MAQIWRNFSNWLAPWGVVLLLVAALASPAVAGTTYTVANVAQLEEAVVAVNSGGGGDLIVLTDHTYSLTAPVIITQDVTIQGDPLGHSVLEGDGSTNVLVLRANHVSLLNFRIQTGLSAIYWGANGVLSVDGLTINGNRDGLDANEGEGEIFVTNSTISKNTWSGVQVMCPANLHMTNVTVSGNDTGVNFLSSCNNVMQITNTLIVGNTTSDCGGYTSGFAPGGATSIDSDGSCVSRGFPGMATLPIADVDLRSLANNGGPTLTEAIGPTSAAINAGTSTGCPTTDQRGLPRNDGFCDIGAYESGSAAPGRVYFVRTPDELETAILDAQSSVGRDRIYLAATVFPINSSTIHTVRLSANDFAGPNDIKLIGAGAPFTILEGGGLTDRNDVVYIGGNSLITIEKVTIQNGGADGIYDNGNLVLRDSIVRNHGRTGIESVNGGLAIFGSTISGNGAAMSGGWGEAGIYVESTFSAVNTTIAGNQTNGIFVDYTDRGASLTNVTIAGNVGVGLAVLAPITITNTIVAENTVADCALSSPSRAVSGGHNLTGDGSCSLTTVSDVNGLGLPLGPLQANGGPTPTMALPIGSPAIDAGGSGACPVSDQRGILRPQGAACDIGAFELVPILINGAPTCVDYSGSTFAAATLSGTLACSDPNSGDTFDLSLVSGASNGVLTLNPDGTFTYVPNSGFIGADNFTFQAADSHGEPSNIATATITVSSRPTTTSLLTTSYNPTLFVAGAPITFQAFVTPATATGTVTFMEGATTLGTATIASNYATIDVTSLTLGTHLITAIYNGDAANAGSTSAVLSLSLLPGTTTVLTSSPNPSNDGEPVTFTITVTGAGAPPTGIVRIGPFSAPLVGGVATITVAGLPVGAIPIRVPYDGDAQNYSSMSNFVTQVVRAPTTTSLLTTSYNPTLFVAGAPITFQAFVTPATATGTVTFMEGATTLGTATIASNYATIDVTSLTLGTHLITAIYNGDAANAGSTSAVLSLSLLPGTTTVLTSSPNPSNDGEPVTFTVTVTGAGAPPTGIVRIGPFSAPLVGGVATITVAGLPVGTIPIRVPYDGDAQNYSSMSNFVTQVVRAPTTTSLLTTSYNPTLFVAGAPITFQAFVTPATATGTVTFMEGATTLGTATIASNYATIDVTSLTLGTHLITAIYNGDAANAGSTSAVLSLSLLPGTTTVLTSSPNPSNDGEPVTFTITVTGAGAPPTGIVRIGPFSAPLVGGVATITVAGLPVGTIPIRVPYDGDAQNYSSMSNFVTQVVRAPTTTSLLTWSLNPAQAGLTLPFIATVTPATATGTVTFKDGTTTLGTATISGGVAMFDQPGLPVGTHPITAVYNGDATNAASTSPVLSLVVNKAPTTTSVKSSGSPSIAGVPVTFTATVTGANPTGAVSFVADGTINLCSNTSLNGTHQASCSTSSLAVGTHAISVSYDGDSNNLASVGSLSGFQVVNTGAGANITVNPDPAVSLTFSNISTVGTTTAVPSATGPPTPSGFLIPSGSLYWEISTTATYTPPIAIEVCIVAPPGVADPRLLHYQGGAWMDVTTRMNGAFVCGNVTSLSPFVVAVPEQSTDVATQLQQLQTMVESFNLRKPATKKFIHRLDEVQKAWADTRHQKDITKKFCEELDKFMRDVEKATGKTLTADEAAQLLTLSQLIGGEVGCGS